MASMYRLFYQHKCWAWPQPVKQIMASGTFMASPAGTLQSQKSPTPKQGRTSLLPPNLVLVVQTVPFSLIDATCFFTQHEGQ